MTPEIALVLFILFATIVLFVTEAFRVDGTAILIMPALPGSDSSICQMVPELFFEYPDKEN
jgi:hypothetical protein